MDAVHKALFSADHRKIDGVEILLTIETPGQVGFFFDGGVKAQTKRALEPKETVALPIGDLQLFNQRIYRDKVPKCVQFL